jgi:hypothetical protein
MEKFAPRLSWEGEISVTWYVLAWFPMLFLAIANGALRQLTFGKRMPELQAHQLSTAIGSVIIGLFIWFIVHILPPSSARQAIYIGLTWVFLTVGFEFAMGRFIMRRPWRQLIHDYNLTSGRVWTLFLLWLALAPYLLFKLR